MTHLDTLRQMLAVRPCGRNCGCGGCQERAALEEAIRVMEREGRAASAEPFPARSRPGFASAGQQYEASVEFAPWLGTGWFGFSPAFDEREARLLMADRFRATARALEAP